jgi:hypothetical protein
MKNSLLFFTSCLLFCSYLSAQDTGLKVFPAWGMRCTIPEGWIGQEAEGVYLIASQTLPGLILLMPHQTTHLDALRLEAALGLSDPTNGIELRLSGDVMPIDERSIAAKYQGFFSQTAASAFAVGLVNPLGTGATIMVITESSQYGTFYQNLVLGVARSMTFTAPETPDGVKVWREQLSHCRLTRLESYNSGYGSGGYTLSETIHLCREGYFRYFQSSGLSMDTGGASGYAGGQDQGRGGWSVVADPTGQPVLQLSFDNGQIRSYRITWEGDKTFLNGERYFRTYGDTNPDDGPLCGG